jgi:lipopolysaccharide transport system permease protein
MAELIIEAGRTEGQYWRDLWRYRELFYVLAWRDIMVRYKQTAVGILWAIIQPLATTIILTVVFQFFARMKATGNAPYPIMVLAGAMAWTFFSGSLSGATQSVISSANLISKIYFPRLIVPAGAVVTALADLFFSFILLALMMAWYRFVPSWHLVVLPLFVLLAFLASMGPGILLTALTVKYRDVRMVVPFIIQVGNLASPVGYSSATVHAYSPALYPLYCLNPMVGVIEGFRWCILGNNPALDPQALATSVIVSAVLLLVGVWYFRKVERSFADVI